MGRANKISVLLGESRQHYHCLSARTSSFHFCDLWRFVDKFLILAMLRRSILLGGICINNGGTQREAGVNEDHVDMRANEQTPEEFYFTVQIFQWILEA